MEMWDVSGEIVRLTRLRLQVAPVFAGGEVDLRQPFRYYPGFGRNCASLHGRFEDWYGTILDDLRIDL